MPDDIDFTVGQVREWPPWYLLVSGQLRAGGFAVGDRLAVNDDFSRPVEVAELWDPRSSEVTAGEDGTDVRMLVIPPAEPPESGDRLTSFNLGAVRDKLEALRGSHNLAAERDDEAALLELLVADPDAALDLLAEDSPQAFVLMPFEDAFDPVYEELIKKPLSDLGYEVTRADSLLNQQSILRDVVRGIAGAHLVVADVTGLNENVLYELGLAHALGVRTVMLTQDISELPFDLRPYRANEYPTEFHRAGKLQDLLRGVGQAVLEGSAEFSNPVQDFAPEALRAAAQGGVGYSIGGGTSEVAQPVAESGGSTAPDVDTEEPGWLELLSEVEQSGDVLTRVSNQIAALTRDIGAKIEAHTRRLQRAREAPQGQRSAGMLSVAQRSAQDLNTYAESLYPAREELNQVLSSFSEGATSMARHASIADDEDVQAAQEMLQSVVEAAETMGNTVVSTLGFAESLEGVPHVHRNLTNAARGASREVEATAEAIYNAEAELARTRELLEERIEQYHRHNG